MTKLVVLNLEQQFITFRIYTVPTLNPRGGFSSLEKIKNQQKLEKMQVFGKMIKFVMLKN